MITGLVIILSILLMDFQSVEMFQIAPMTDDDTTCLVSPRLPDHPQARIMTAPTGDYPVWFVTIDSANFTDMARSFPPYHGGTVRKSLINVSTELEGDLTITGHQLDGDGIVLFPIRIDEEVEYADGSHTILYSADDLTDQYTITNAQIPTFGPNAGGYAHHPWAAYYPKPGCYELTGTYGGFSTSIIVEVRAA